MATKGTIKLAGPANCGEHTDCYKVLSVTNTLRVKPGDVYSEKAIEGIVRGPMNNVTIIEPKIDAMSVFSGDSVFNPARFVE